MNELLNKFYNHEIIIDVREASDDELKELEEVIGIRYPDGTHLYPRFSEAVNFFHCRDKKRRCTFSDAAVDYTRGDGNLHPKMNYVSYKMFIKQFEDISEDELMSLYK